MLTQQQTLFPGKLAPCLSVAYPHVSGANAMRLQFKCYMSFACFVILSGGRPRFQSEVVPLSVLGRKPQCGSECGSVCGHPLGPWGDDGSTRANSADGQLLPCVNHGLCRIYIYIIYKYKSHVVNCDIRRHHNKQLACLRKTTLH